MYKLLLATNDPAVVEAFSAVKWEELGFKQPTRWQLGCRRSRMT